MDNDINDYLNELETFKIDHGKFPALLMRKFSMSYDEAEMITTLHIKELQDKENELIYG